jgi:hypothetical protein
MYSPRFPPIAQHDVIWGHLKLRAIVFDFSDPAENKASRVIGRLFRLSVNKSTRPD